VAQRPPVGLYRDKPAEHVRAVLSVLPKELQVESITGDMSKEELESAIAKIRDYLRNTPEADEDHDHEQVVH
jgi:hypothetical protein